MVSAPVAALRSPPTASISSAIWRAVRRFVPLNAMCSRKCEMPCSSGRSSRLPEPTQTPSVARLEMRHRVGHHRCRNSDGSLRRSCCRSFSRGATPTRRISRPRLIGRQHGDVLRTLSRSESQSGSAGVPARGVDRVGKFRRMRGRQHHHRHRRIARFFLGHRQTDRRVRIDAIAGLAHHGADGRRRLPPRRRDRR